MNIKNRGFTIVELLVVIVVIGILAAIIIVSYTGVSQKAVASSLKADLYSASSQLKIYQVENSAFPNSITDCPTPSNGSLCLKSTPGNVYSSYSSNNSTNPQTFALTISNNDQVYKVTSDSIPEALASAQYNPVADWLAVTEGDHYGNFYDLVTKQRASVTRSTPKTIYDSATNKIYDIPVNKLAINPRSDGKSGSEAVIEEARTNYLLNSFGASNTSVMWNSGWMMSSWHTASTPIYSIVSGIYRNTAQRIQYTGNASDYSDGQVFPQYFTSHGSFLAGEYATLSVWMRGSGNALVYPTIQFDNSSGANLVSKQSSGITLTDTWTRYTITSDAAPINTSRARIYLWTNPVFAGKTLDLSFDAVQLEKGRSASSYTPTTNSIVTRASDVVTVPATNWNSSAGTIIAVAGDSATRGINNGRLFTWGTATEKIQLHMDVSGNKPIVSAGSDSIWVYPGPSPVYTPNTYFVLTAKWEGTLVTSFTNGVVGAWPTDMAKPMPSLPAVASLSSFFNGSTQYNGPSQRFIIYPSALSNIDIISVTNAIKDGP